VNKKKQAILDRVDRMIERLEQPLPEAIAEHPFLPNRGAMLCYYRNLRSDLVSGKRVWRDPAYYSVARGLDFYGFADDRIDDDSADLRDEATAISNMIWDYSPFNQLDFLWDRVRICFSRRRK
jgi:hypothetical protein